MRQVILHRLRAQEQRRPDLLVRLPLHDLERYLELLRCELLHLPRLPLPQRLAPPLPPPPRSPIPGSGLQPVEQIERAPELVACLDALAGAAQALSVAEVGA